MIYVTSLPKGKYHWGIFCLIKGNVSSLKVGCSHLWGCFHEVKVEPGWKPRKPIPQNPGAEKPYCPNKFEKRKYPLNGEFGLCHHHSINKGQVTRVTSAERSTWRTKHTAWLPRRPSENQLATPFTSRHPHHKFTGGKKNTSLVCCYLSVLSTACSCLYPTRLCSLPPYLPCWISDSPAVNLSKLDGFLFVLRIPRITRSLKLLWSSLFQALVLVLVPVPHIFPWTRLTAVITVILQHCSADHSSWAWACQEVTTSQRAQK